MKMAICVRASDGPGTDRIGRLLELLNSRGADVCVCTDTLPSDVDMLLALGGDGTFLSTLKMVYGRDIPVAGINFGRLGFLTSASMDCDSPKWVDDLLEGRYTVRERSVLQMSSPCLPDDFLPLALNEFVIRRKESNILSIDVSVDGHPLPAYWADGLMFVTPTGSTAYSLSLGGPVVMPGSRVMLITPLASHNLNVRPLVIPLDSTVEVLFHTTDGSGILTADNRAVEIPAESVLRITCGTSALKCISLNDDNFINALSTKLLWGEDRRNVTL